MFEFVEEPLDGVPLPIDPGAENVEAVHREARSVRTLISKDPENPQRYISLDLSMSNDPEPPL